jgi:hypothetical protein
MQGKALNKTQHPFTIKALMKLEIERMYLITIKVIYNNPIVNIIPNGEKLKPFPLKLGTNKDVCSFHSYKTVLEFLDRAVGQEE